MEELKGISGSIKEEVDYLLDYRNYEGSYLENIKIYKRAKEQVEDLIMGDELEIDAKDKYDIVSMGLIYSALTLTMGRVKSGVELRVLYEEGEYEGGKINVPIVISVGEEFHKGLIETGKEFDKIIEDLKEGGYEGVSDLIVMKWVSERLGEGSVLVLNEEKMLETSNQLVETGIEIDIKDSKYTYKDLLKVGLNMYLLGKLVNIELSDSKVVLRGKEILYNTSRNELVDFYEGSGKEVKALTGVYVFNN